MTTLLRWLLAALLPPQTRIPHADRLIRSKAITR